MPVSVDSGSLWSCSDRREEQSLAALKLGPGAHTMEECQPDRLNLTLEYCTCDLHVATCHNGKSVKLSLRHVESKDIMGRESLTCIKDRILLRLITIRSLTACIRILDLVHMFSCSRGNHLIYAITIKHICFCARFWCP